MAAESRSPRPAQNSLLPGLTETPADLTAANVVSGVVEGTGKMLGPIAFTNAYLTGGSYAIAFGLLALPAAAGLACVWVAHAQELRLPQPAHRS